MNGLWWKQWHENRRYLVVFVVWMTLAALYCIAYELGYRFRAPVGHFSGSALFYTIFAAIFLAMHTAQGEQTRGTLSFSLSLPVSPRRIAAVRIAGAVATLVIPVLVAAALLSLALISGLVEQAEPRGTLSLVRLPKRDTASLTTALEQLGSVTAIAIFGGTQLLLVLCVCGCWLRSQAQVGFLGALMGLGSLIAGGLFWFGERRPYVQLVYGALFPQSLAVQWGYKMEVGGYTDHELAQYRWFSLGLAIPVLAILGYVFVTQYGRLRHARSPRESRRIRLAMPPTWPHLPAGFPGRLLALIWLELRQSAPLAFFGLLFAFLVALVTVSVEPPHLNAPSGASMVYSMANTVEAMRAEMSHTVAFAGMLWAAIVGSALFSADLRPGLGCFWRSRPISPGMWFWCKFFIGLAAVLVVLDGVTILISWNAHRTMTTGMSWAYIGCFPIIHALFYALAVLGTCWFRKPVIGGLLAILGYAVLTITISTFPATNHLEPIDVYNELLSAELAGEASLAQHGYPLVYGILVAFILLAAFVSSRLARPLDPRYGQFLSVAGR